MTSTVTTRNGETVTLDDSRLAEISMGFRGEVVSPGSPDYDDARVLENLAIDKHPGLLIRCTGVADVADGVALARDLGLPLAIRSGGHHVGGHGSVDGGVVLDLRAMNGVWVDPGHRTVRVQGGATWGQVDRETQIFGLAVPGGVVSTTGVGGLTLGGGIGWLHRQWGLACDNLVSAELVLASGELVTASADENPDLFWAIRGGGGNFGIAVSLTFHAHPVGPEVALAAVFHPIEAGAELLPQWRDLALESGDEVTTRALFWGMPPVDQLPPPIQGKDVMIIGALYAGGKDEGMDAIAPFRALGDPLFDMTDFIPTYGAFQAGFDALASGLYAYWKSLYLDALTDEAMAFICDKAMNRPDPATLIHVPIMGGATAAIGADATAFGDRSAPFMLSFDGQTRDPSRFDEVKRWVRASVEEAHSISGAGGAYLNFSADPGDDATVLGQQYGGNLARLRQVKAQYDPENFFRINNNITPA